MLSSKQQLNQFSREVIAIMPFLVREFAKREDNELTRGKISCPQMVALDYASKKPKVRMAEIAKVLDIKTSSATALVERLIQAKMLMRWRDEEDRRVVWVKTTPKGKKVVTQILEQKRHSIKAVFSPLTDAERSQYIKLLKKAVFNLNR